MSEEHWNFTVSEDENDESSNIILPNGFQNQLDFNILSSKPLYNVEGFECIQRKTSEQGLNSPTCSMFFQ
jgi:hypothetical protein